MSWSLVQLGTTDVIFEEAAAAFPSVTSVSSMYSQYNEKASKFLVLLWK